MWLFASISVTVRHSVVLGKRPRTRMRGFLMNMKHMWGQFLESVNMYDQVITLTLGQTLQQERLWLRPMFKDFENFVQALPFYHFTVGFRAVHYKEAKVLRLYKLKKLDLRCVVAVFWIIWGAVICCTLLMMRIEDFADSSFVKLEYDIMESRWAGNNAISSVNVLEMLGVKFCHYLRQVLW